MAACQPVSLNSFSIPDFTQLRDLCLRREPTLIQGTGKWTWEEPAVFDMVWFVLCVQSICTVTSFVEWHHIPHEPLADVGAFSFISCSGITPSSGTSPSNVEFSLSLFHSALFVRVAWVRVLVDGGVCSLYSSQSCEKWREKDDNIPATHSVAYVSSHVSCYRVFAEPYVSWWDSRFIHQKERERREYYHGRPTTSTRRNIDRRSKKTKSTFQCPLNLVMTS